MFFSGFSCLFSRLTKMTEEYPKCHKTTYILYFLRARINNFLTEMVQVKMEEQPAGLYILKANKRSLGNEIVKK